MHLASKYTKMKIDQNRTSPLTGSLKSDTTGLADPILSKTSEITDTLDLSTKKEAIDRTAEKREVPPAAIKSKESFHYVDRVELSKNNALGAAVKEKTKTVSIITQEMVDALPKTPRSHTYNAKAVFAGLDTAKSQLLEVTV